MSEWVFSLFFPLIGTICSNLMYSSSILVVRLSRRQRFLGKSINPIPWAFGAITSFTWFIYGVIVSDIFIITANAVGVLVGLFACSTAFTLLGAAREEAELKYSANMETVLLGGSAIWVILAYIMVVTGDDELSLFLIGIFATAVSILMYMAPLSSIPSVIRLKDASSIYTPQVLANGGNAACWAIYGLFGVGDVFVWAPNVVGILCTLILLSFRSLYPARVVVVLGKVEELVPEALSKKEGVESTKVTSTNFEDPDRPHGFSNASVRYRGRLASVDAGEDRSVVVLDKAGALVRMPSSRQFRMGSVEDSNEVSFRPNRGIVATVQTAIELQNGESAPPLPSVITKLQDTVGSAVEVVRARAESLLQRMEDTVINTLEPILGVEVVEAASNLRDLYQEQDQVVQEMANLTGEGWQKPGTTVQSPLETIAERRDSTATDVNDEENKESSV